MAMIPIHLIEYQIKGRSKKDKYSKDLGRYIVGGKDCKIKSIIRPSEIKQTENFAKRETKIDGTYLNNSFVKTFKNV
jgi:hypothetical protein